MSSMVVPYTTTRAPVYRSSVIGYHYTALSNVPSILASGLHIERCREDQVAEMRELGIDEQRWDGRGLWVWKARPVAASHAGSIMFAAFKRGEANVALLRVAIAPGTELSHPDPRSKLMLTHVGKIGEWQYHRAEPAWIVTKPIPANLVQVVETYDIIAALAEGQRTSRRSCAQPLNGP